MQTPYLSDRQLREINIELELLAQGRRNRNSPQTPSHIPLPAANARIGTTGHIFARPEDPDLWEEAPHRHTRPDDASDEESYDHSERNQIYADLASDAEDYARSEEDGWFYGDEDD